MAAVNADNADRGPAQLAWVGKIDCPDAAVAATAALMPVADTLPLPLWPNGRLRLLTAVRLDSVPAVLFTPVAFDLFINTRQCEYSKRYVNGLVNALLPPMHTALLARIEGVEPAADVRDPFVESASTSLPQLPTSPFVAIYAEPTEPPRLALHMLDTSAPRLEALSLAIAATSGDASADTELRAEHAFIAHLARLSSAEQQDRIQRTLSAESSIMFSSASLLRTSSAPRSHTNKRMTLSDIELFAAGDSSAHQKPTNAATAVATDAADATPSEATEEANKKLAKQLIIAALKVRGTARDHKDFAALWSQIYRSLKFALRGKISCRIYSVRDLRAEVEKHTSFYCT